MDRCAILVDAGYLLGAASTLVGGDSDRSSLDVDHAGLVRALIDEAQQQTGIPLLRVLWYDAAYNAQPTQEHRTLRVLPDVKIRLGELVRRGDRVQQKGVDSYLQRDLTALARNHAIADAVLVGGDEDLRRALEEAQEFGVRIHLWGVAAAAPEYNQSQSLIGEADRRWVISEEWIKAFIRLRPPHLPTSPAPGGHALRRPDGEATAAKRPTPTSVDGKTPTPLDIERLRTAFGKSASPVTATAAAESSWTFVPAEHDDIPRLQDVTAAREAWHDNEEDATRTATSPAEVGARFGRRWASRVTAEQRDALLRKGTPPPYLDGELLRYAARSGIDTWEDEPAKHGVRKGFWDAVSSSEP